MGRARAEMVLGPYSGPFKKFRPARPLAASRPRRTAKYVEAFEQRERRWRTFSTVPFAETMGPRPAGTKPRILFITISSTLWASDTKKAGLSQDPPAAKRISDPGLHKLHKLVFGFIHQLCGHGGQPAFLGQSLDFLAGHGLNEIRNIFQTLFGFR